MKYTRVPAIQQRPFTHVLYSTRNEHTLVARCVGVSKAPTVPYRAQFSGEIEKLGSSAAFSVANNS